MAKTLASQAKDGGSIPLARSLRNRRSPAGVQGVEMLRRILLTAVCCGLAAPASAPAAAGPMMPLQGGSGVTMPGLSDSYLAVRDGHETQIDRRHRDDWSIGAKTTLPGHLGVPA